MQKWYCSNCGTTTYLRTKPPRDYKGPCSTVLAEIRHRLATGDTKYRTPKNRHNHYWHDAEEYERDNGSLPSQYDLEQEYEQRQASKKRQNDHVRGLYGNDLYLPNGKLNEYYHLPPDQQPKEKSITEEVSDAFNEVKNAFKSIKSIFFKPKV